MCCAVLGIGRVRKDWGGAYGGHGVDCAEGEGGGSFDHPLGVANTQPCKAPGSTDASLRFAAQLFRDRLDWLAEEA